jgi:hypothetical protein
MKNSQGLTLIFLSIIYWLVLRGIIWVIDWRNK